MVRNKIINHVEVARKLNSVSALMAELLALVPVESDVAGAIIGVDGEVDIIREYMDDLYLTTDADYDVRVYYPKEK